MKTTEKLQVSKVSSSSHRDRDVCFSFKLAVVDWRLKLGLPCALHLQAGVTTLINRTYIVIKHLGSGTYGQVKLAFNLRDKKLYAIKACRKSQLGVNLAVPCRSGGSGRWAHQRDDEDALVFAGDLLTTPMVPFAILNSLARER